MNSFLSRDELNTIAEGIMDKYSRETRISNQIDIDHFAINYLKLNISYVSFAETDKGKIGFLADGKAPLMIYDDNRAVPFIFPKDTIVIDRFLLSEREEGRRRFTIAHEAAHHILKALQKSEDKAYFHDEFDKERVYTRQELARLFSVNEWQADAMGAAFLMPERLVESKLKNIGLRVPITIYGETVFSSNDKMKLRKVAQTLGVSYTALYIRLKDLNLLQNRDISEFIDNELKIGG